MKKIGIVVKKSSEKAEAAGGKLKSHLVSLGLAAFIDESKGAEDKLPKTEDSPSAIPDDIDMVVVMGGDGTLLYAARALGHTGAPILGVNLGGLGFMAEIGLEHLYPTIKQILAGKFETEKRMMLNIEVERDGKKLVEYTVLNDGVINKAALARILDLKVRIDGKDLTSYRADGLIIATPTGSTAYNLSAGGPIVHPSLESLLLTPICPFTLSNRPLLLPENAEIEIEIDPEAKDIMLTLDGQLYCHLVPGDIIKARKAKTSISLITNPYKDYFDILRTKLGWGS